METGGSTLFTRQRYCDVALEMDFRVAPNQKSNSGIFLRVHNINDPVNTGKEPITAVLRPVP